ncbi:MAG: ATP-dependent helicase [Rhodothermales bacterium]|nr:ATP-dependent helicase [Rhodothermales bacterium]
MARKFVLAPDNQVARTSLTINYQDELNPQQYDVVTSGAGPSLVVAGAGTGKTRTLIFRVAYLVETGVPPDHILLLTFTRRSAAEMLNRASQLLDGRCQRVRGGTFHAYALSILRRHAPSIGYPRNFTILDSGDSADVIDVLRTASGFHKSDKRFPRKRTIYSIISACSNGEQDVAEVVADKYPQFVDMIDKIGILREQYHQYKLTHGLMDYDDLLSKTVLLFENNRALRDSESARCRHVLVDEYQDTNRLQARMVAHLASVHRNVMAVGDDAQSIYGFRGADTKNIFQYPEIFEGTTIYKLEHNYRSTQQILNLANTLIEQSTVRYDKKLFTEKPDGELPAIVGAADDQYECRFVCQMIMRLREEGIPLHRVAVLFRNSHNSFGLEIELNRRNIPFIKFGGLKLNEAAHIKDVLSYLKILENPRDAVAWTRVLQLLPGIGPKTAADLVEWISSRGSEAFELTGRSHSPRYIDGLKKLFNMLRAASVTTISLPRQIEMVLEYYDPILKEKYYEDFPKREQDLEQFASLTDQFKDRESMLSSMALDPIELTALDADGEEKDEQPLVLSTIHSAKGLEYHTVFVIQALDGVVPSTYSLKEPGGLDEELRLLYVAVTRAEENLFITYPMVQYRRFQGDYMVRPSRYLDEISDAILEPWTLVETPTPSSQKLLS